MPETPFSVDEPKTLGDVIVRELSGDFTFQAETVLNPGGAAATLEVGLVLGRVTASGKLVPHAPGAADGSQNAIAVLAERVTLAASGEARKLTISRMAILRDTQVVWAGGISGPQKTAAIAALDARHILIREDV
jgi:hypothetical protein